MKIGIVGKFDKLYDEEYIARSFEELGHEVVRMRQNGPQSDIHRKVMLWKPEVLLFTKWDFTSLGDAISRSKEWGMKTVCWVFDLYFDYDREAIIKDANYFKADYVFTTDGGHAERWKEIGVNHNCVRQGIYSKGCYLNEFSDPKGIAFVGSENPLFMERTNMLNQVAKDYEDFKWYGRRNTHFLRGDDLNRMFSSRKIILGDSVYWPYYWSNRVVETLGRGGFLIHRDVPGIKEEYPHLVTYDGSYEDLKKKIDYYLEHEDERREIVRKNFEHVKADYLMTQKCQQLLSYIS